MDAEQMEQPAVGRRRCVFCRRVYARQLIPDGMNVCPECSRPGAAAVELDGAADERGTRSVQRVDGRAGRTEDVQERARWVVEWYAHKGEKWVEASTHESELAATEELMRMFWRGFTARVVAVAVVERRWVVGEMPPRSPIVRICERREKEGES